MPNWILDLETTGLLSGFGKPRRDVGISEWALWSSSKGYRGGHTDILRKALSAKLSVSEYHAQLASGMPTWQEGFARPGDVLAGVHERHVSATYRAFKSGSAMASEKQVLRQVGDLLASGQSVGGWNVEFDFGVLEDIARRTGDSTFMKRLNQAWTQGRVVEMSDPARRFLFNLAREGAIELGQTAKTAKALAARPGTTPGNIAALTLQEMFEPHEGFRRLFQKQPNISYEAYKAKLYSTGGLEDLLGVQEFSEGLRRPKFRYVKGWRQHVLAQAITPGFLADPTSTQLGQEIGRRLNLRQGEKVTAHLARDDTVLTGILNEIFSARDPWKAMSGYGVKSKAQFLTQYQTALEQDIRHTLGTYLGEQSKEAMDISYLRKVLSGAEEMGVRASDVARKAADPSHRFPGFRSLAKGTLQETMDAAYKHPKAAAAISVVGAFILADSLIPEDNKLEGRRRPDSRYAQIRGVNFGGIGSAATQALTDFGSGRSEDNAASQIRAWKLTRDTHHSEFRGFSIAEVETAQQIWSSAKSQRNRRLLERSTYEIRRSGAMSIPGVTPDAWVGVLDLKRYRVKTEDADTVNLYRRGLLHVFDKPIAVRMAGIDAPETHPRWPFGMQPMGTESGEYLRTLIDQQTSMSVLIDPNRTTYGRHVGVLSGDVHPNINLKLVSAGAAAAYPSRRGITTAKAFERAEAQAAAAGLGMWSSKGWQAKRMLDMSVNEHVSNVTFQNARRIADGAGLEETYHLVQDLHDSPKPGVWEEAELDALTQVMAMRQSARQWQVNANIKRHGWTRGIRDGASPWNIVDPGILPSHLDGANVSAFGSGWTRREAEDVQRMVDPLRRRFLPQAEPIMTPGRTKSAITSYVRMIRDRARASLSLIHRVGPRTDPAYKAQHILYKPALKAPSAITASGAATSVGLVRPKISQHKTQSFLGSMYSVPRSPWKPLNEYQAVHGGDFAGNWQIRAWSEFRAGAMKPSYSAHIYMDLYRILKNKGFSREAAAGFLKRYGVTRSVLKTFKNKVDTGTKAGSLWSGLWTGREAQISRWANNFIAGQPQSWAQLKGIMRDEFKIRKLLWKNTVAREPTKLGKLGAFAEFFSYVGEPMAHEVPSGLAVGLADRPEKIGRLTRARNWAMGKQGFFGRARTDKAKSWAAARIGKYAGAARFIQGVGQMGGRALSKVGGPIGAAAFTVPSTILGASQYKNQALGAGVEFTAAAAFAGVWGLTHGAVWAGAGYAGALAGGAAGGVIGGFIGSAILGVGAVPGAALGAKVGAVAGKIIGIVAAEIAYGLLIDYVVGEPIRKVGGIIAGRRNASPHMPDGAIHGPQIPGMSMYGGTDQYLTAGHGIQGRPEFSGFGGGLKPMREMRAVAETLGKTSPKTVGAGMPEAVAKLSRPKSQLGPTAGLTNVVLWGNRHRITRGRSRWPVQWEQKRRQTRHASGSRMMRAA